MERIGIRCRSIYFNSIFMKDKVFIIKRYIVYYNAELEEDETIDMIYSNLSSSLDHLNGLFNVLQGDGYICNWFADNFSAFEARSDTHFMTILVQTFYLKHSFSLSSII